MKITLGILRAALDAFERCPEGEVVHVHADGTCTHGTDGATTHPAGGWGDIVYLFDAGWKPDPWDCFVETCD